MDFSTNNLIIQQGTNGGALANIAATTINTGTLASGAVIVIGTSDMQTTVEANGATFKLYAFTFNGDDALAVKYGATITDVFGTAGIDPGSAWTGGTVSTANQNIGLLTGISTGDTDGWTDPSLRFETISTTPALAGGINGFGIAPTTPVPVQLTSFTAKTTKAGVMLNWTTATEVNNFGFDVETLNATSSKWEKVGFVEGHGNSNSPKEYSFFDNSGATSYRLKQVDFNGNYEYSDVVTVKASLAKTELYQNSPNPFNPSTKISFSLAETGKVNVSVYNVIGQKVADLVNQTMESGVHNVDFNASNLPSGLYIYRLDTPNYSKTMKMMLLK